MECEICAQSSLKLPFHCTICARSALYTARHDYAVVLADKEAMGRRVEAVIKGAEHDAPRESLSLSGAIIDTHDCAKAYELEEIQSESAALSERIRLISERAQALNLEMKEHKKSIISKKAALSQRRSDAESATYGREGREKKELEAVEGSIKRMKRRWEMKHEDIVIGRSSLCKEAARLAGLSRVRRSREDGSIREFYTIGNGLNVFDLRELHSEFREANTVGPLVLCPCCLWNHKAGFRIALFLSRKVVEKFLEISCLKLRGIHRYRCRVGCIIPIRAVSPGLGQRFDEPTAQPLLGNQN